MCNRNTIARFRECVQNGQIHTWQAHRYFACYYSCTRPLYSNYNFHRRQAICLQPRIDILSLLLSLFFHGNNCQKCLIFLSFLFFFINWRRTTLPLLIIKINRCNTLYRSMFFPIWNGIKKKKKVIISKLIIFILKHVVCFQKKKNIME